MPVWTPKVPVIYGGSTFPPSRYHYKPLQMVMLNVGERVAYRCTDGEVNGMVASVEIDEESGLVSYWLDFSSWQPGLFND
jgi:hypothetical protein